MPVIDVALGERAYQVMVGSGLLAEAASLCEPFLRGKRPAIVTDANVASSWRATVDASFAAKAYEPEWLVLPPGEASKGWATLQRVCDWLLERGIERGDYVLALGGGVIGDLVGFAAAILKRGCGFIQLPTTLLAQVDSSVGGKTAINVAAGKNLIGAFHQPALVLADLAALETLPARELRAGYAEVIKYGILGDAEFFAWCERSGAALLAGDRQAREFGVVESVAAKARIVAADERETAGRRALLNLGHTFGHALEAEAGFGPGLLHGEAVAMGMVLAARYSQRRGMMPAEDAERIAAAVGAAGLPTRLGALGMTGGGARLVEHMLHDKKMDSGSLPFVLLEGIGRAVLARDVPMDDVARFLDAELASAA